jgi:hypothetical protein
MKLLFARELTAQIRDKKKQCSIKTDKRNDRKEKYNKQEIITFVHTSNSRSVLEKNYKKIM